MNKIIFFDSSSLFNNTIEDDFFMKTKERFNFGLYSEFNFYDTIKKFPSIFFPNESVFIQKNNPNLSTFSFNSRPKFKMQICDGADNQAFDTLEFVLDNKYSEDCSYTRFFNSFEILIHKNETFNELLYFLQNFFWESSYQVNIKNANTLKIEDSMLENKNIFKFLCSLENTSKIFYVSKENNLYSISSFGFHGLEFSEEKIFDSFDFNEIIFFLKTKISSF